MIVLRIIVFALGFALVAWIVVSAIIVVILPRGSRSLLNAIVFEGVGAVFRFIAGRRRSYEGADRVLALHAPFALVVIVVTWLTLVHLGFILMYWALGYGDGIGDAFFLSGSSLTTLGFAPAVTFGQQVLAFVEAGIGLLLLTLLITYLPTLYAAFSAREAKVTLLEVRAGSPPSAAEFLIRYSRIGRDLAEEWLTWESWFASLEESHTSYPVLAFFRSPDPDRSWITAAGTVLDAAALWVSAEHGASPATAGMCIRAGYLALRRIADFYGIPYPVDPAPTDPIAITRGEFDVVWGEMEGAGLDLIDDPEAAWVAYAGWRVNYDAVLLSLAEYVRAPYAPWSSDRSTADHVKPHLAAVWPGLHSRFVARRNRPPEG